MFNFFDNASKMGLRKTYTMSMDDLDLELKANGSSIQANSAAFAASSDCQRKPDDRPLSGFNLAETVLLEDSEWLYGPGTATALCSMRNILPNPRQSSDMFLTAPNIYRRRFDTMALMF